MTPKTRWIYFALSNFCDGAEFPYKVDRCTQTSNTLATCHGIYGGTILVTDLTDDI